MSHFDMFFRNKANVKLVNLNTVYYQVIGIILCTFINYPIIYPVGPVYYCPGHPYNKISSATLKRFLGFQKVTSKPLESCDFICPQGHSCRSP